jgi:hypothetical protein
MSYSRRPKVDETMWDKANRSARRVLSSTQGFGTLFFAHLNQRDAYGEYPEMCETKQKTKYLYARTPRRKERERERKREKERNQRHPLIAFSLSHSLSLSLIHTVHANASEAHRARITRWHFFPQFSKVIVTPQKPFDEEQLYFGRTKVDNNGSSSEKNVPHACVTNASSRGGDLSRSLLLSHHHTHQNPFETNLQTTAGKMHSSDQIDSNPEETSRR